MKPKFIYFLPAIVWLGLTTFLLVVPGKDLPQNPFLEAIYFDKWVHIGLFGGLTLLLCFPFLNEKIKVNKLFIIVTFSVILYGILMEFVQKFFTEDRNFDITDMLADSVGCIIAYAAAKFLHKKKKPL